MDAPTRSTVEDAPEAASRCRRVAKLTAGGGLLLAAAGYAIATVDPRAWADVGFGVVASLGGLVLCNIVLTGLLFWSVTRAFPLRRPVGRGKMVALIAVSGLLNYLPLIRAGLWGRAAYLRRHHGLSLRDSMKIAVVVLILAAAVVGGGGAVLLVSMRRGDPGGGVGPGAWFALAAAWLVLTVVVDRFTRRWGQPAGAGWGWVPLRVLDFAAATARVWLSFKVMGAELGLGQAAVLSSASLLTKLSGLTPNGLGLAEWVVTGLAAAISPAEAGRAASAALLDRGVEVAAAVVAGLAGLWMLARWDRQEKPEGSAHVAATADSANDDQADRAH